MGYKRVCWRSCGSDKFSCQFPHLPQWGVLFLQKYTIRRGGNVGDKRHTSGTIKLADMAANGVHEIADGNGVVYFTNGSELWKTNGTPAGTLFIIGNLSGTQFTTAYGQLFFISSNQLWKSDGTAAGTAMVTGFGNSQTLSKIFVVNGKLLLKIVGQQCSGYLCSQDWQLYKSDGTQTGTLPVADFSQTVLNCPTPLCFALTFSPENSTVSDGKWFFEALDSVSHSPKLWMVTNIFFRCPPDYWAFNGWKNSPAQEFTGGCGAGRYCPDATVTRAQMAVFLLKGIHGSSYTPPAVGASTGFTDVATDYWAAAWIKQLAAEGITGGCGSGNYCPDATVTRAQMAVFLLKAKHGSSYSPPAATGVFTDVPVGYWADKWIEQLAA